MDIAKLKNNNNVFEFEEDFVPTIKCVLKQTFYTNNPISDMAYRKRTVKEFTNKEIHDFIQSLINEYEESGLSEEELKHLAFFLNEIFGYSISYSIRQCHQSIELINYYIRTLSPEDQYEFLSSLVKIIKKETADCMVYSAICTEEFFCGVKEHGYNNIDSAYKRFNEERRFQYRCYEREKAIFDLVMNDPDLKAYIEKKIDMKLDDTLLMYMEHMKEKDSSNC